MLENPSPEFTDMQGVYDVHQDRSKRSRDAFIKAGMELLNQKRLVDIKVSELASHSGRSVGAFYKRFKDKETFFASLQAATIEQNHSIFDPRLSADRLLQLTANEVLEELVDVMADIFSGETRGVLRESLLRILEPVDGWTPMRARGQEILARIVYRLKSAYPNMPDELTERKLKFCYQIVVSVLQNDLVNDFHAFSTKDESIRVALKTTLLDHMHSDSSY